MNTTLKTAKPTDADVVLWKNLSCDCDWFVDGCSYFRSKEMNQNTTEACSDAGLKEK